MDYVTNDSGKRVDFSTGSRRDTSEGKWRIDLIWVGFLVRIGDLLARGAKKYDLDNWRLGQPIDRSYESALRHLFMWRDGEKTEDHLAAVCFNIMSIMYVVANVKLGKLPLQLMMALDKEGNPTDKFFECADMPTSDISPDDKSKLLEPVGKLHAAIQNTIITVLAKDGYVMPLFLTSSCRYPNIPVKSVLDKLTNIGLIVENPNYKQYDLWKYDMLPNYTQYILRVLIRYKGKPVTYKFLRDNVESLMICDKIHDFAGHEFLTSINQLVKINVVKTDSLDGNYVLA